MIDRNWLMISLNNCKASMKKLLMQKKEQNKRKMTKTKLSNLRWIYQVLNKNKKLKNYNRLSIVSEVPIVVSSPLNQSIQTASPTLNPRGNYHPTKTTIVTLVSHHLLWPLDSATKKCFCLPNIKRDNPWNL